MVSLKILENCPTPHMYVKAIKDKRDKVIDFEIIQTNLYSRKYLYNNLLNIIEYEYELKSLLEEALNKGTISIKKYLKEISDYIILDLQNIQDDNVIIWLSKDNVYEKQKDTLFEMVYDSIPDAIFIKNTEGRYLKCNQSFSEILKLPKEHIIGHKNEDIHILKFFDNNLEEVDNQILESRESKTYLDRLNYPNGDSLELETKKTPFFNENNEVVGIVGIARDISHRKKEEKELEKLRMDFFANLSHEFRTPINLIFSSVQLINIISKDEYKNNTLNRCLGIIKQNSYRLSKLVNNLIDSTKISSGYFEYSPQNHDIISFIESICMSVAQYANQRDIEIIFDTEVEEKIIGFDLNQVERIVLNLLSNAIKFSESNGTIFINIDNEDGFVKVKVRDEGIGIPEEKLNDVFKMFKQVNNRMTKVSEGSGIGLSLVKSLVERHGGYVSVKSKINQGAEFSFALPDIMIDKTCDNYTDITDEPQESRLVETIKIEFSDIY